MAVKTISDEEVLLIIRDYIQEYGYAPTYRELAERCELALSTIGYRIKQLRKEGLLEDVDAASARTLVPSTAGLDRAARYRQRAGAESMV